MSSLVTMRSMAMCSLAAALLVPGLAWADFPAVPLPENSRAEAISSNMKFNGLDMKVSRFATPASVEQVLAFYASRWPGGHVVDEVEGKTIVGRAEGRHYVTVELVAAGQGTEGTIGIMRMPEAGEKPSLGDGVYRPNGTEVESDIAYLDGPSRARTVVMRNRLSPYTNLQHYLQRLHAQGWKNIETGSCTPSASTCVARFEAPRQGRMSITMNREQDMTTSLVAVLE